MDGLFGERQNKPANRTDAEKEKGQPMAAEDVKTRHLLDLLRKSEKTASWQYSSFLSPAEQEDLLRDPEAMRFPFILTGGYENAERKILSAGDEESFGPPDPPSRVIAVAPKSSRFAEDLTHRDYLGTVLGLGIDRGLVGDILVRENRAWLFCLSSAADMLVSALTRVRRTAVSAELVSPDIPELQPRYELLRLNLASERLDAVAAAFTRMSRAQVSALFSAEKVFVNSRAVTDRSARLKEGDSISIRGFGKAVYDGIEHETRKNRLWVILRKLV